MFLMVGRSLSLYSSSVFNINPDIPEAHKLRGWYTHHGKQSQFQSFGTQGPVKTNDKKKMLDQIKTERLGQQEKVALVLCLA